jgi:hypothetical protein
MSPRSTGPSVKLALVTGTHVGHRRCGARLLLERAWAVVGVGLDTPMQRLARSHAPERFPWVQMFHDFASGGLLVRPEAPSAEIVTFLEGDAPSRFSERRFGVGT